MEDVINVPDFSDINRESSQLHIELIRDTLRVILHNMVFQRSVGIPAPSERACKRLDLNYVSTNGIKLILNHFGFCS